MKMKTQLTLAAVVAAGLLASGCSQQMVAQQAAAEPEPAAPKTIVKTIVDCSKCKKPTPPRRGGGNMHSHPAIPGCTDSIKHNHPHAGGARHSHKYGCKKPARRTPPRVAPKPVPAPKPAPRVNPNTHTHPAIPKCTNSIRHTHPNGNRPHSHRYSCRKAQPRRAVQQQPMRRVQSGHVHPAIPGCTDSIRHNHPVAGGGRHTHRYSCRGGRAPAQVVRPVQPNYQQMATPKIKPKGTYKGSIKIDSVMQQYQN